MKTLALIIGNNEYYEGAKLTNAINDAKSIQKIFETFGFDIISKFDCLSTEYSGLLEQFESRVDNYDATIFYYAGHGFELEGENYFPAINGQIPPSSKHAAGREGLRLNEIFEIYKKFNNKVNIAIIDACRKNFDRGSSVSLAPVIAPKGSLIAFSTSPGVGASDLGYENNSIYTGSLIKYLGTERLTVEELFKKVRKTVYTLSRGKQTTWEHTSLISDFYFNKKSNETLSSLPYEDEVVKDVYFDENKDHFSKLIKEIKSSNWHKQNPAIEEILKISPNSLNINELFILGRNLLQSSGAANNAVDFMLNLNSNLSKYTISNNNHLLNGILFEIYFNSYGEFRVDNRKDFFFQEIIALRKMKSLKTSFDFIRELLSDVEYDLIYLPEFDDKNLDVTVLATSKSNINHFNEKVTYQFISSITYGGIDITEKISTYNINGLNEFGLQDTLSKFLSAPIDLIKIHSNITLEKIAFIKILDEMTSKWS